MEEVISLVNKVLKNVQSGKSYLTLAEKAEKLAKQAISSAEASLRALKGPGEAELSYGLSIDQTLVDAPNILKEEVETAVLTNDEYAYTPFLTPLLDIASDEELYNIIPGGTGWSRSITVELAMNEVAGDIEEYAQAVEAAREEMGSDPDRDPIKASHIWRTKIWPSRGGGGPYQHVISSRLANLPSLAPFWSLLNDGNKSVSMSSDIGGTAYPSHSGTHFVEKAERRIVKVFKDIFSKYKINNRSQISELSALIDSYREALQRMYDAIQEEITSGEFLEKAAPIQERLRTKTLDDIDPRKLLKAVEDFKAGRSDAIKRVNVGRRGTRVRLSPSTLALYD